MIACCYFKLLSQVGIPKRTIVHTLGKNEILKYDEYYTYQYLNKVGYSCIVKDTLQDKEIFILNGKKVLTDDYIGNAIYNFDVTKESSFTYEFFENEKYFVNIGGKIEGPFEAVTYDSYYPSFKTPEKYNFFYKLGDKWYAYYEGKVQVSEINEESTGDGCKSIGGFSSIGTSNGFVIEICNSEYKSKMSFDKILNYDKNDNYFAWIGDKDGKRYFCLNNVISEPFDVEDEYNDLRLNGSNYSYTFMKNGKRFININGKNIEVDSDYYPYCSLYNNGTYYFSYSKKEKSFININGRIFGPYDDLSYSVVHSNGKFAFVFAKEGLYFFNNNGIVSQGFPSISDLEFKADGKFKYLFSMNDGWVYENNNGLTKKVQDRKIGNSKGLFLPSFDRFDIFSKNKKHQLSNNLKYDYVVIDGRSYGKAPAIKAWYDEPKNSFVWNACEGKELVLYEFKLD